MGDLITKVASKNACLSNDSPNEVAPKYHFKCRFHPDDEFCLTDIYTRTTDKKLYPAPIKRFPVPLNKTNWTVPYDEYSPTNFTSAKNLDRNAGNWIDPDITHPDYEQITFNQEDKHFKCERKSHHGNYRFIAFQTDSDYLAPQNPVGRTGLIGRGHLGRWGPNHAADPIVTTWKRKENGDIEIDAKSLKPILKFVAIQRRDTKEWAIPGGMRDPGELVSKTLVREFAEEALSHNLAYNKDNQIDVSRGEIESKLSNFFRDGVQIYKGYVDDPRNTDNAWMETIACNFHDEKGDLVGSLNLVGGDDAEHANLLDLNSNLKLFASHVDFLAQVAALRKAHW